ncbi:MAG TPA: pitrilysin family protein [Gemmatimonadaceae bacterium]|nr:pitrilysin family protein [Gemmatimonadaceae bacterium]
MTAIASIAPAPGKTRAYHFPRCARATLPSGAKAVVAPMNKLPLVTVTLVFHRAGADADPVDRDGLATLTAAMVLEGTQACDGSALTERFESLGSVLTIEAEWDATLVSFTVQPERLDAAVSLVTDVLGAPAFPARALDRLRAELRAERMQLMAEPRTLADAAFAWQCYGSQSRYRRPLAGTAASVAAITLDDVEGFWRTRYAAAAATIVVAGDVTESRGMDIAARLGAPRAAAASPPTSLDTSPREGRGISVVARPGAAQAEVRIGHIGVPRGHPEYFPLTVMNAILGGLFSSRVNLNLREKHGYTYGAFSSFDWRTAAGPWIVSTAVKTDVTAAAAKEVLAEIDRIRTDEVDFDELALATQYLAGVFPLRFETTLAVAGAFAAQAMYGLPADYFDTYRDRVAGVTPAQVRTVAREHLHPEQLAVVVVGDPNELRAQSSNIGTGGTTEWSPDDVERAL